MKGKRGGLCNRSACLAPGAHWYNRGSLAWYCESCAHRINAANHDAKMADGKQMIIYVPPELTDEQATEATRFVAASY